MPTKIKYFSKSFLLIRYRKYRTLLTVGTLYISLLKQQVIWKSKTEKYKIFLNFVLLMIEGSGSEQIITDPDPGGPKTYCSYRSVSGTLEST